MSNKATETECDFQYCGTSSALLVGAILLLKHSQHDHGSYCDGTGFGHDFASVVYHMPMRIHAPISVATARAP